MLLVLFKGIFGFFFDILESIVVALAIFVVVYLFLYQPHQVKGASMEPNFHDAEYILTNKYEYRFGDPKRGDVVVFKSPQNPDVDYIKRVIGLPGEHIKLLNNHFYINEVLLDWFIISGGGKNAGPNDKLQVLLVAIHNDTISKFRSIASDAGVNVAFFEIEVFSAVRAALDHGIAPIAVVDMGAGTTKFYVVERGIIRESHIISHGSQDLTLAAAQALSTTVADAEQRKRKFGMQGEAVIQGNGVLKQSLELSLSTLFSEIARTVTSYEAQKNQPLSAIVFTGGGATLKGLQAYAQEKIQTEIRLANPFAKTQAPAFLEEILKEAGPEFSVAVGLALRQLQGNG